MEGYKLNYGGYDYLALKALTQKGTLAAVGNQIGVGKESGMNKIVQTSFSFYLKKIYLNG